MKFCRVSRYMDQGGARAEWWTLPTRRLRNFTRNVASSRRNGGKHNFYEKLEREKCSSRKRILIENANKLQGSRTSFASPPTSVLSSTPLANGKFFHWKVTFMFWVHWDERQQISHICSQPYLEFSLGQVDCLGENFITFELCSLPSLFVSSNLLVDGFTCLRNFHFRCFSQMKRQNGEILPWNFIQQINVSNNIFDEDKISQQIPRRLLAKFPEQ